MFHFVNNVDDPGDRMLYIGIALVGVGLAIVLLYFLVPAIVGYIFNRRKQRQEGSIMLNRRRSHSGAIAASQSQKVASIVRTPDRGEVIGEISGLPMVAGPARRGSSRLPSTSNFATPLSEEELQVIQDIKSAVRDIELTGNIDEGLDSITSIIYHHTSDLPVT